MSHALSFDDERFAADFTACRVDPRAFDHRAHLRLAYIYLAEHGASNALALMRSALLAFIEHNQIPAAKYHETLTQAWLLAVRHFMATTSDCDSSASFLAKNPRMLDAQIMLTHYSDELLFSAQARAHFVEPDLDLIPR